MTSMPAHIQLIHKCFILFKIERNILSVLFSSNFGKKSELSLFPYCHIVQANQPPVLSSSSSKFQTLPKNNLTTKSVSQFVIFSKLLTLSF